MLERKSEDVSGVCPQATRYRSQVAIEGRLVLVAPQRRPSASRAIAPVERSRQLLLTDLRQLILKVRGGSVNSIYMPAAEGDDEEKRLHRRVKLAYCPNRILVRPVAEALARKINGT